MSSTPNPPVDSSSQTELAESFVLTLPDDPASGKDWYLWAGVLALLVFVAFFPAVNGTLLWDDDHHVGLISSQHLDSLQGLAEIWTRQAHATPQYYPLTFTSFWLEHLIWGENLIGYHLGNLLLHAASAVLVWRLLRRLGLPGAWVAAAIWAVHPLQTESVCWMSERKNVLSGLLFFSSIWFYLEYAGFTPTGAKRAWPGVSADGSTVVLGNKRLAYCASLLCLILGLFAKTVVCAMPAVMLILLWWKGRKLDRKSIVPLIPFFAVGLALSAVTVYLETAPGVSVQATGRDWALTPIERLLIAGRGVWFYVGKTIWPARLTFSYPRIVPSIQAIGPAMYAVQWGYVLAAAVVLAGLWSLRRRLGRGPLAALLYFGVTLFPSLGFINIFPMRYSFVADHFQYLSGLGLIVLAVAAAGSAVRRLAVAPGAVTAVAGVLVALLAGQSWLQAHVYTDAVTLYQDILAKNPGSWMAADNLGVELTKLGAKAQQDVATDNLQGQTDAAATDAQDAQDDFANAERLFRQALAIRPDHYLSHSSLGLLYRETGRWDQAESELRTAVEMDEQDDPGDQIIAPYLNYAGVLEHNHPDEDVRPWLDKALALADEPRIRPTDVAGVHLAYGDYWFVQAGRDSKAGRSEAEVADLRQAIAELNVGLQILPNNIGGLYDVARAYQRMGLIDGQKADLALAAGHTALAAEDQYTSHRVDDALALAAYKIMLSNIPFQRHAGALEGIGELTVRGTFELDDQSDVIQELLKAMQCFKDVRKIDPNVLGAADNLKVLNQQFTFEAGKDKDHEAAWAPLQQKLQLLQSAPLTKAVLADADKAAQTALWPLPQTHVLYQPLVDFRSAIRAYPSAADADAAGKNIRTAAASVLAAWNNRKPALDAVNDWAAATVCFAGALESDEHSAPGWQNLKSATDALSKSMAGQPDVPAAQEALREGLSVLDQLGAVTQPTTEPAQNISR